MSQTAISILHLEDSDLDAEFIRLQLQRAKLDFEIDRVVDQKSFVAKLEARNYDLILSDYQVPTFDGLSALEIARRYQPQIPFIFLSGAIGEEIAVETLKRGATDYLLKDAIARLPAAVERAVREARERKAAAESQQEAARANRRAVSILENIAEAYILLDADWRFVYVNAAFERIHGVSRRDILGKNHWEAYPATLGTKLEAEYRRVMAERSATEFEFYYEPTDRWLNLRVSPAEEGGICVQVGDITEAKRTATRLAESEAREAFVREASGVGFWYCDLPFDVLEWDERVKEHFHLPPDARVTIHTFYERIHEEDREPTRQAIEKSIQEHGPYDVQYRTVDPATGKQKWIRAIGRTFFGSDGTPLRFDGVTLDVTAQKDAELALRAADRQKDEFLAVLAHELRNPLAPIRMGLDVLQIDSVDQANAEVLEMMQRQLAHMVRLIDDLLDVARITTGKLELKRERIALKDVLESAIEASRPAIDGAQHTLTTAWPHTPLYLHADMTRLSQIVSNLLNNAARYTPPGGAIRLAAERQGSQAIVRVSDNGNGIPREMLSRVFELFTQAGSRNDRFRGGLGIGLSLVKRLVEMHGGSVSAESDGPGLGATFTITLPLAKELTVGRDGSEDGSRPNAERAERRRILVVDDNVDSARSLAMVLKYYGHATEVAHSGNDAVPIAEAFRPEIVILDIGLPGMDGYEVARMLRNHPQLQHSKLVALTGWGSENDKSSAQAAGFDVHLTKPVDVVTLQGMLLRLTERT